MRTAMLALAAGLLLLRFLPQVPPEWVSLTICLLGMSVLPSRWRLFGCFLIGAGWPACLRSGH